ncbi:MAG TPA: hypothetical protein VN457_02375 [Chlamydiales bacterium]|nr:hypothetical protein [Chlamydiales bacterium]
MGPITQFAYDNFVPVPTGFDKKSVAEQIDLIREALITRKGEYVKRHNPLMVRCTSEKLENLEILELEVEAKSAVAKSAVASVRSGKSIPVAKQQAAKPSAETIAAVAQPSQASVGAAANTTTAKLKALIEQHPAFIGDKKSEAGKLLHTFSRFAAPLKDHYSFMPAKNGTEKNSNRWTLFWIHEEVEARGTKYSKNEVPVTIQQKAEGAVFSVDWNTGAMTYSSLKELLRDCGIEGLEINNHFNAKVAELRKADQAVTEKDARAKK